MQKIKNYLPSFVYGGSDGAVSYFTLMAGAYGAGLPIKMLIAIGISNVCADAFSMASADYLSEDSKDINKNIKKGTRLSEEFTNASVTFFAFILLGIIPLIPTFYAYVRLAEDATLPLSSFLLSSLLPSLLFLLSDIYAAEF